MGDFDGNPWLRSEAEANHMMGDGDQWWLRCQIATP